MSPEEFDNRLRSSFNDEFVPPKEHLWHNINTRLDQKAKRPVWFWLAPIAIVAVATMAWLGNALMSDQNEPTSNTSTSEAIAGNTPAQSSVASTQNNSDLAENNHAPDNTLPSHDLNSGANANIAQNEGNNGHATIGHTNNASPIRIKSNKNVRTGNNNNNGKQTAANNNSPENGSITGITSNTGRSTQASGINNTQSPTNKDEFAAFSKLFFVKRFLKHLTFDQATKADVSPVKWPENKQPVKRQQSAEDLAWGGNFEDNEWWLNFGIGNQIAYNNFHATYDSVTKNKIHRHLIDKEKELTHNGGGFQMHLNLQNKFGKNNRFSFETGLNYSYRTEDIKMNEQTYDIAARNNNEEILNYLRLKLFIAVGTDTTFFDATQSFALVTKNKYSIITLPLRFQYEQPLNRNTFLSLGVGGGASLVKNNSTTHYDMVKEKDFQKSSSKYLTASLNTMLSLYTNYNGIGQFGIYGGYQMYLTPFKVNEQYGVRMSDLQFGVIFRRPLDLK